MTTVAALRALRERFTALRGPAANWPKGPNYLADFAKTEEAVYSNLGIDSGEKSAIDFQKFKTAFPHSTKTLSAFEQYAAAREAHIAEEAKIAGPSPTIVAAVNEKYAELQQENEAFATIYKTIQKDLEAKGEDLEEKKRFLAEIKVSELVDQFPEWQADIEKRLNELEFDRKYQKETPFAL